MELAPGTIVNGQYELIAPLGKGGMGSVWRATQLSVQAPVALKVIAPQVQHSEVATQRFKREAQAAAALRGDPNVVQVIDYGVDRHLNLPYLAMELLAGRDLAWHLRRRGKLTLDETLSIVKQVCKAVARAHAAGIVHRDLKPANIFLVEEETLVVKVLDFGIAKTFNVNAGHLSTKTGAIIGTAHYMSPEQVRGRTIDGRTDMWAIAVIAFECLTGVRPFEAESLGELTMRICAEPISAPSSLGDVPDGFDAWFEKATQRNPADRFQTVQELLRALSEVCGEPVDQLRPGQSAHRAASMVPLLPAAQFKRSALEIVTDTLRTETGHKTETLAPHLATGANLRAPVPLRVSLLGRWRLLAASAAAIVGVVVVIRSNVDRPSAETEASSLQPAPSTQAADMKPLLQTVDVVPSVAPYQSAKPSSSGEKQTPVEVLKTNGVLPLATLSTTPAFTDIATTSATPSVVSPKRTPSTTAAPRKRSGGDSFLTRQ